MWTKTQGSELIRKLIIKPKKLRNKNKLKNIANDDAKVFFL